MYGECLGLCYSTTSDLHHRSQMAIYATSVLQHACHRLHSTEFEHIYLVPSYPVWVNAKNNYYVFRKI